MQQIMMLQQKNNSAKTADSLTPITEEISILANQAGAPLRGNSTNPYYSQQNQFSSYNQQITKQAPSGFFNTPISVTSQQQLFQLITQASTYEAQALIFYNYRNADQYNQNLFQQAIQQLSQYKILAIYANTQSDAGLQSFVATLGFGDPGGTGDYSGSTPAAYYHPGIITCKFNNTIQQNQQATQYNITQFLSNPQLACNSTMINGNNVSAIQNAIQQFISSNNIMPSINTNFAYSGQQNMLYQPQQTSQQNMLYQAPMMNQNYNNSFSRNTTSNPFYTNKNPSVKGMITTPGFMPI
jgi:hypothetical protein